MLFRSRGGRELRLAGLRISHRLTLLADEGIRRIDHRLMPGQVAARRVAETEELFVGVCTAAEQALALQRGQVEAVEERTVALRRGTAAAEEHMVALTAHHLRAIRQAGEDQIARVL